jgi:homoserine O-acetyltransferase
MDSHNVGRGRDGAENALHRVKAKALVVAIDSDVLFPAEEQQYLAANIPHARFAVMHSLYGHDGFLLEYKQLQQLILQFLSDTQSVSLININKIQSNEHIA